jgi:hypothetical protein
MEPLRRCGAFRAEKNNRALYLPERRVALNAWAEYVGRLEAGG